MLLHLAAFCRKAHVYDHVYAPGPATRLSIPSLYTGLEPPHYRVCHNRYLYLSPGSYTLAEFLRDQGYRTSLVTGNRGMYDPRTQFLQGFTFYDLHYAASATSWAYVRPTQSRVLDQTAFWHPFTLVDRALSFMTRS